MNRLALKAQESQRQASHPEANVWVSASAGSGKTKVLCDRILNLLLEGVLPQRILCLTFTNAAAAEMANRLQERVGAWAICEEDQLTSEIRSLREGAVTADHLTRARLLFDVVLESPGGLKIQTLHGFCQSLLKRFPLESGLPPHFQIIDEMESRLLLREAQRHLFEYPPHPEILAYLLEEVSETLFSTFSEDILNERGSWSRFFQKYPDIEAQNAAFKQHLHIEDLDPIGSFWRELQEEKLRGALQHLGQGSVTEQGRATTLFQGLASRDFEAYQLGFLTLKGELRVQLFTKAFAKAFPSSAQLLEEESLRVLGVHEKLKTFKTYQHSKALALYAQGLLEAYHRAKKKRAVLDYDDLILETLSLLETPGTAPWVLYKFDGGIDHMMIDEAQDTSPAQWDVIKALTEEFFSSSHNKTLFVVGDEKQSIYSFQGADPKTFSDMKAFFKARALEKERPWVKVGLGISFRSAPEILEAVDAVFQNVKMLSHDNLEDMRHESFRSHLPGHVEVWPLAPQEDSPEFIPWDIDCVTEGNFPARTRLAQKIAKTIHGWLQDHRWLQGQNRSIRPGDILILMRKRSFFVDDVIYFLKEEGVPVAGVDRLRLQDHTVIQDLKALLEFILLPENDLALAMVLKSPLVGMGEEDLFHLAWDRGAASLWDRLQESSLRKTLSHLIEGSRERTPFAFLMWLLGPQGAREKFVGRLGAEAQDAFEEMISLSLRYEQDCVPSLQGFLSWLDQGNLEIKRDLEEQNEVRVMTVHGSKGLQAPIVFLPDTTQVTVDLPKFAFDPKSGLPLWIPPQTMACSHTEPLKAYLQNKHLEEYRRLLYVAMTRAQDELYVAGWESGKTVSETSWYHLVHNGVAPRGEILPFEGDTGWSGDMCVLSSRAPHSAEEKKRPYTPPLDIPRWLFKIHEGEIPQATLTPSHLQEAASATSREAQRGILIHTLLERWPTLGEDQRAQDLERITGYSASEKEDIKKTVSTILTRYPEIFGENSLGEVPLLGKVGDQKISGQVDRLVLYDHKVQIIDYKTTASPGSVEKYRDQLTAYALLLADIYPHHEIECGILWTVLPQLEWLDLKLLEKKKGIGQSEK